MDVVVAPRPKQRGQRAVKVEADSASSTADDDRVVAVEELMPFLPGWCFAGSCLQVWACDTTVTCFVLLGDI